MVCGIITKTIFYYNHFSIIHIPQKVTAELW